jgi:hypothetical protein
VSQENVEIVLALQPAADEDLVQLMRDGERLQRLVAAAGPVVHEDVVSVRPASPGGKEYVGLGGFRALWLDWLAPWQTYRVTVDQVLDKENRVALPVSAIGTFPESSTKVTVAAGGVYTVTDGQVTRIELYDTRDDALKAVGLEE